jgi:hypothetical protein
MNRISTLLSGLALVVGLVLTVPHPNVSIAVQQPAEVPALTEQQLHAIKVTIMTGGGLVGPAKTQFHVGERVPIVITMLNTSKEPLQVCVTGTMYQDLPELSKDGQVIPVNDDKLKILKSLETDKTCERFGVPSPRTLSSGQSAVVDWFVLARGNQYLEGLSWFDPLPVGKYEISLQRRLGCCTGPLVKSNKISFEVIP